LADSLNLAGTARYNLAIRHRLRLAKLNPYQREKHAPVYWEGIVSFYNHSELAFINQLAQDAGATSLPFKWVEPLIADNGERFFSEYLKSPVYQKEYKNNPLTDRCQCNKCALNPISITMQIAASSPAASNESVGEQLSYAAATTTKTTKTTPPKQYIQPTQPTPQIQPQTHQQNNLPAFPMTVPFQQQTAFQMMPFMTMYSPMSAFQYHPNVAGWNQQHQQPPPPKRQCIDYCCEPFRNYKENGGRGRPQHTAECNDERATKNTMA
jgi:hypothetical protein